MLFSTVLILPSDPCPPIFRSLHEVLGRLNLMKMCCGMIMK
jgi:hypothetical protein